MDETENARKAVENAIMAVCSQISPEAAREAVVSEIMDKVTDYGFERYRDGAAEATCCGS